MRDPPPCAKEADAEKRASARKHEPTFNNINSGFYFLRSSKRGIELIERAIKVPTASTRYSLTFPLLHSTCLLVDPFELCV